MVIEGYKQLISNDENSSEFIRIYDVFHRFVEFGDITEGRQYLISEKIDEVINRLIGRFQVKKTKYINSSMISLRSNINSFISAPINRESIIKRRKLILSYISFELSSVSYLDINRVLTMTSEEKTNGNHKIILVLCGVDLEEDDINAIREMCMIRNTFLNTNYHVIAYVGCTIDIFRSFVKNYEFQYFHFVGHGTSDGKICFYKSNAKPETVENIFISNFRFPELSFFNSCNSYSFYGRLSSRIANNYIVYDGDLSVSTAFNFSETYYGSFVINDSGYSSFQAAQLNHKNTSYKFI